jgi:NhaA family Na+:H+ antiporter
MKITNLFKGFFESEKAGGIILVLCAIVSLVLSNTSAGAPYIEFWSKDLAGHSLEHWINDGLMTIFFLLIGLELEREIYAGELSDLKTAMLPVIAAIGGMAIPALIYLLINWGQESASGAGIPMATDIAFALAVLALLGKNIPYSLRVFLTALAVIDDLGAILIIAFFYTSELSFFYLAIALGIFALLLVFNRKGIKNLAMYLIPGVFMWYCMLHSGVHASISGVLLAFAIPFGDGAENSVSYRLQHFLHKPVAYIILPLFALANTCILIDANFYDNLLADHSTGILSGLVIGKPLGIFLFSALAVATGFLALPAGMNWKHLAGAGILGGIGFTMSIFITNLAFTAPSMINDAKFAIICASVIAALSGFAWLRFTGRHDRSIEQ